MKTIVKKKPEPGLWIEILEDYMTSIARNFLMLLALFCFTTVIHPITAFGVVLLNGDFSQVDSKGAPANWQLASFLNRHNPPPVTVVTEEGRKVLAFLFNEDGTYCFSFYQKLPDFDTIPEFDQNGVLIVTFSYRAEMGDRGTISIALSGSPGCALPCLRNWLVLERDGNWHQISTRFPLAGLTAKEMVLEYMIESKFKAGDKFTLAKVQAEITCPIPIVEFNPVNPVSGVMFTDMPSQKVTGLLRIAKTFVGYQVRLSLAGPAGQEKPSATQNLKVSYPVTRWDFDLQSVPEGTYTLSAELLSKENKVIADKKIVLWRLKPTDTTSRIINGKVYYGGKPIVLLGAYHVSDWAVTMANDENQRIGTPPLTRQQMLASLAGQGFNSFCFTSGLPKPDFMEDARKYHLFVIPSVDGRGSELVERATPLKDDPSIFWYGSDESESGESAKRAVEAYYGLKRVSPHKLVVCSLYANFLDYYNGEATPADLVLMDIYRVTSPDADLSEVGLRVRDSVTYAQKHGNIAVGVVPQAFIYHGSEPTPEQLRAQVYLGLVNGAQAFFMYAYIEDYGAAPPFTQYAGAPTGMSLNPKRNKWFLPDSKMWFILPDIFQEIKTLENFVVEDGEVLKATSENEAIQFMAKQVGKEFCLIAVNPKATPQKSTFCFSGPIRKVTPLFNTSPAEPQGEKLPLEFKGYEVKVFQLERGNWFFRIFRGFFHIQPGCLDKQ